MVSSVCLYREISFICVIYLFDLLYVLKFQFNFVIWHISTSQIKVQHFVQAIIKGHFFVYNFLNHNLLKKIMRKSYCEIIIVNCIALWVEWIVTSLIYLFFCQNVTFKLNLFSEVIRMNLLQSNWITSWSGSPRQLNVIGSSLNQMKAFTRHRTAACCRRLLCEFLFSWQLFVNILNQPVKNMPIFML